VAQVFDLLDGEFTLFAIHTQLRISAFITVSIARSASLPVFNLLRGRF